MSITFTYSSVENKFPRPIQALHRIVFDPVLVKTTSIVRKSFQLVTKSFSLSPSSENIVLNRDIKSFLGILDFYATAKNIMFWVNPFSKETLDKDALSNSLQRALLTENKYTSEELADTISKEVMAKKRYYTKRGVLKKVKMSLKEHGYQEQQIQNIAKRIVIRQKSRPLTQLLSMACFTLVDFGSNLKTLQSWGALDLVQIAVKMGMQSRVATMVVKVGLGTVLGSVASAGLILVVGEASYRIIIHASKALKHHRNGNLEERAKALQEFKKALLDALSAGTELVAVALPLLVPLNPPIVIGLAIFAKTTGIVCLLVIELTKK